MARKSLGVIMAGAMMMSLAAVSTQGQDAALSLIAGWCS